MLVEATLSVPASLMTLLAAVAPLFTDPSFRTWHSVFGTRPVTVVLIRDRAKTGYDLALVTTDTAASPA